MNEPTKEVHVGDTVIYADPKGVDHNALCTAVWSPRCINVVFVSQDKDKGDSYGRQIERQTSVSYVNVNMVHGQYWRFLEDEKAPHVQPLEK